MRSYLGRQIALPVRECTPLRTKKPTGYDPWAGNDFFRLRFRECQPDRYFLSVPLSTILGPTCGFVGAADFSFVPPPGVGMSRFMFLSPMFVQNVPGPL